MKRAIIFLVILSAILLISDLSQRADKDISQMEIAVFKHSSRPLLDNAERGIIDALKQRGFLDGENIDLTYYCAENDMPTANTIASEIINQDYDMVLTTSTPILQVMANANRNGKVIHVFAAVTDPFSAGVGLSKVNQDERPPYLAGLGTFQPVEDAMILARMMNPGLKKLGTVWCNFEACSEACVNVARVACDSLNIDLLEITVDNSSSVLEATNALIARGVEALWVGGDNTVEIAMDVMVDAAFKAGIPVFCNNPDRAEKGALFGLGANYYQVGLAGGNIAADILEGQKPDEIPVQDVIPEKLVINEGVIKLLSENWTIPPTVRDRADNILFPGENPEN